MLIYPTCIGAGRTIIKGGFLLDFIEKGFYMNNKKWMAILLGGIMAASLAAPCSVSAAEKTTLTFWHAMGGTNGEVLQQIVDDFNASQDEIEIKAEYQGTYDDTITKLKAAMQSESGLPDVCQMYDVGTKFMYDSGAVIPVEDKFESTGYDKSSVMDVISSYYTVEGKQYAMPFNVSTPMLYYNKDDLRQQDLILKLLRQLMMRFLRMPRRS